MKVRLILKRLKEHGLYLDLDKYEFTVKIVKYLRFIIYASIGI